MPLLFQKAKGSLDFTYVFLYPTWFVLLNVYIQPSYQTY